jgi:crotonobetainyl-CoA:carnitine CoA-transferase CaiB-like acyl-CoA transferase
LKPRPSLLQGMRVTDLTSAIFGPFCTQHLVEFGAEVVKVEPPAGDGLRHLGRPRKTPGMGKVHMTLNRGKRSAAWDLKSEKGRENLRKLIKSSDVFIHNIRAKSIAELGFDYEAVRVFAPDIIYVHCTGFDSAGPNAGQPAYDDIIQAGSGLASAYSDSEGHGAPAYIPFALADKIAGLYAAEAALMGIIHKLRFGTGQLIEVPMFEAVTAFHLLENFGGAVFPDEPGPIRFRGTTSARHPFATSDGYISMAPYSYDRWVSLFKAIGRVDLLEDEKLGAPNTRRPNNEVLSELLSQVTLTRTTAEWLEIARIADIPAMRFNGLEDLLKDPQLTAVNFFRQQNHPTEGRFIDLKPAIKFSAGSEIELGFPPLVGEDNAALADELDL